MATLRDIKARITGVKNTQQITKAMKMVAAARLRRAQEGVINARPYSDKIKEVIAGLMQLEGKSGNPLFEERPVNKVSLVVVTSDRGFVGSFNMNIIKQALSVIENEYADVNAAGNLRLYCVGKKGSDYFTKNGFRVEASYTNIFSPLRFETASGIMNGLVQDYLRGETDRVVVIYNEFKSVIQQRLCTEQLLPVRADMPVKKSEKTAELDYIFEPDKASIINELLPKYLKAQLWRFLLESYAAELGAKMTAMDMATENAKEIIRQLQLKYNNARQAAITKELIEIVSGANALKA